MSVCHLGDCLEVMSHMEAESIDAIVTDPPYGLGFMGKGWDHGVPGVEFWTAALRVAKPGAYLLAFGGTRTFHRLAVAIEDAGWEIRDNIGWLSSVVVWCYGSGFPKSLNVSKDERFCQRVPGVCDAATEDATESAAQVLLSEVRGNSKANAFSVKDLHDLPLRLHPDFAVSGGEKSDVLAGVREHIDRTKECGTPVGPEQASDCGVRDMRDVCETLSEQVGAQHQDLLHIPVRGEGKNRESSGARLRRHGHDANTEIRCGQSGVEGRRDVQAPEGELHRPQVRQVPAGSTDDGEDRRLRDGTPSSNGPLDTTPSAQDGSGKSHRQESKAQPTPESGTVPDERRSQTRRGWPICGGCGKPRIPRGLGTALKPAFEPVIMARKPLVGTVAANVEAHGTGALNIDGCRVEGERCESHPVGRWPANLILSYPADEYQMRDDVTPAQLEELAGWLRANF